MPNHTPIPWKVVNGDQVRNAETGCFVADFNLQGMTRRDEGPGNVTLTVLAVNNYGKLLDLIETVHRHIVDAASQSCTDSVSVPLAFALSEIATMQRSLRKESAS